MKTDDLIRAMAADAGHRAMPVRRAWLLAGLAAVLLAGGTFLAALGPRPDALQSLESVRYLFKFSVTLALAASAFAVLRARARPEGGPRRLALWLALAPTLLLAAVLLELSAVPEADWGARLIGTNSTVCLTFIPLIGIGPLAVFLLALRHGAPTRLAQAGALAGLMAGGLAGAFYAAHCPDDSPLFVAVWYSLAIAGLAGLGALLAPRIARW